MVVMLRMGNPAAPRVCPGPRVGCSFSGFPLGGLMEVLFVCLYFSFYYCCCFEGVLVGFVVIF